MLGQDAARKTTSRRCCQCRWSEGEGWEQSSRTSLATPLRSKRITRACSPCGTASNAPHGDPVRRHFSRLRFRRFPYPPEAKREYRRNDWTDGVEASKARSLDLWERVGTRRGAGKRSLVGVVGAGGWGRRSGTKQPYLSGNTAPLETNHRRVFHSLDSVERAPGRPGTTTFCFVSFSPFSFHSKSGSRIPREPVDGWG